MLNAERFKEEINKHNNEFGLTDSIADCKTLECRNCRFSRLNNSDDEIILCSTRKVKWLLSEYKEPIKLSKVEYEILRYLYKRDYRYITREKSERVIAFKGRPHKRDYDAWNTISGEKIGYLDLYDFSNLFQFTNWEDSEPTPIKEVLENCEVVDDD